MQPDIVKISAVLLNQDKHLLIARKRGMDTWISLGGKPEPDEDAKQTLKREINEETGMQLTGEPELYHESPVEESADGSGKTVQIFTYLVTAEGEPTTNPNDTIEELHWLTKAEFEARAFKLGSVLQTFVIPKLISEARLA